METTIVYWAYIGIVENKMEAIGLLPGRTKPSRWSRSIPSLWARRINSYEPLNLLNLHQTLSCRSRIPARLMKKGAITSQSYKVMSKSKRTMILRHAATVEAF